MCTCCNNNSCSGCCNQTPLRYKGPDIDCLGISNCTAYDALFETLANEICDLNTSIDGLQGFDHVSFTSSTGTPSSQPNQPCETDTYTFWGDVAETVNLGTFTILNPCDGNNYADVAWVDDFFGDDSTGTVGRFDLPYKTINAAITAANVGMNPQANVYVRRGHFTERVTLVDGAVIYLEPGVTFTGGGFSYNLDPSIQASVLGYGRFEEDSTPLRLLNAGDVTFQCEYVDTNSMGFYGAGSSSMFVYANYVRSQGIAAGFVNSFRDSASAKLFIKEFCEGPHAPYFFRGQNTTTFSGDVYIECPVNRVTEGGPYGAIRKGVIDVDQNSSGDIEVKGEVRSDNSTADQNREGVVRFVLNEAVPTEIILNGDVYGGVEKGIVSGFRGSQLVLTMKGNIHTPNDNPVDIRNASRPTVAITLKFFSSIVHANAELLIGQGVTAYFHHCSFYNSSTDVNNINISDTGTNNSQLYFYSCVGETGGGGGYFVADNVSGFTETVGLVNSHANVPLDISPITDIWGGFSQIVSLVVPKL